MQQYPLGQKIPQQLQLQGPHLHEGELLLFGPGAFTGRLLGGAGLAVGGSRARSAAAVLC